MNVRVAMSVFGRWAWALRDDADSRVRAPTNV